MGRPHPLIMLRLLVSAPSSTEHQGLPALEPRAPLGSAHTGKALEPYQSQSHRLVPRPCLFVKDTLV